MEDLPEEIKAIREDAHKRVAIEKSYVLENIDKVIEDQKIILRKMMRNNNLFLRYFEEN